MPSPNKGEKQPDFMDRCMGSPEANKTFPEGDQRAAFCHSQWDRHQKPEHSNMADPVTPRDPMTCMMDREIFSVGTWKGSQTVVADTKFLDQIVKSYNELNSKVDGYAIPIKLGHNKKVGEPAYGYAENVRRNGKTLMADFVDMPPEIVDAINQKRYNAVSVELWPKIEHAGAMHEQVLGGVALLGAEWPAVKGLKPLYASEFAADGALTLSKEEDTTMQFTQEQHDAILASAVEKATKDMTDAHATEMSAANAKVTSAETRAETAEAALSVFQDEAEQKDMTAIIEAAEKSGKIVPANKDKIVAFASQLRKSISAADRKAVLGMFKDFVEGLPVKVDFKEKGASASEGIGEDEAFSAADEVDKQVKLAMKKDKALTYRTALAEVFKADPALKTRYAEETR